MGIGFCLWILYWDMPAFLRAMALLFFQVLKLPLAVMRVKESALQSILNYYQSISGGGISVEGSIHLADQE